MVALSLGLAALALAVGFAAVVVASRTRQRRLRPSMVVMVEGNPYFLSAVPSALNDVEGWALEPLGELLARTVILEGNMTLFEILARAGWKPPPADDRPVAVG